MLVDGRALAREVLLDARAGLTRVPVVRAVVVTPSPATESYLSTKAARAEDAGMRLVVVRLPEDATDGEVIEAIEAPGADAVIVQLPLPPRFDTQKILDAIPLAQDADVLSRKAYEQFVSGVPGALLPPVVEAVAIILSHAGVSVRGKRAVVVGQGRLVGEPVAQWLKNQEALVSVVTLESGELSLLKKADIIVSGAGAPGILTPEHLTPGVVLIDAGTSESRGAIVGDADASCATIASVFTPVPGGVGPLAVACLFRNTAALVRRQF